MSALDEHAGTEQHERPFERIQLRVTVSAQGSERDLVVHAAGTDSVSALVSALTEADAGSDGDGIWCPRRGKRLSDSENLADAGVRWGDRLILGRGVGEPTRVGGEARIELLITGGPCAGERFELGDGTYRVGRDASMDIVIADPSMSRHHLDLRVGAFGATVTDVGASNGTSVDGHSIPEGTETPLGESDELEAGRTQLRARTAGTAAPYGLAESSGRLDFNRPPRINPPVTPFLRELPEPPERPRRGRLPLAAALVPLAVGLLLFYIVKSPVMLAVAAMSPLMAVSTFLGDRRGGAKSFKRETSKFERAVDEAITDLAAALASEVLSRREASPDAPALIERLSTLAAGLWERRPGDVDFLCLRLGVADQEARSAVLVPEGGDPDVAAAASARLAESHVVPSVPLVVDFREAGVVGISGDRTVGVGLARWFVLQAAILHSPGELVVLAAVAEPSSGDWEWLKWLPHLRSDRLGLQCDPVAVGIEAASGLLAEIRDLIAARLQDRRAAALQGAASLQVLLLIDEDLGIDRALVSSVLTDCSEAGVSVLWLGRTTRDLPGQTGAIIELDDARAALSLTLVASGARVSDVNAEAVSLDLADRTARMLAPVRDVSEMARAADIPKRAGLLELLGLLPATTEDLVRSWKQWDGSLRSTIGVGADGPLSIDLRSEGPHALIAGTTGSGKSELLRTFVASAAAQIPPDRLSFLLVDYKGGAAFAPCAALPHVVDIVSDLDEHLAERALVSLNAELKRRELILADSGAKDLSELARRSPESAPPWLVIAVDEFAKLRDEVPEFVDGVVDIAQRGRSLGVHMVLAAQSLRNAFTPAIRANTNLRVALRVSDDSESEDVIASPLAARIPSGESFRGRAFVRTGHGELREFQAAYVSGLSDPQRRRRLFLEPFELASLTSSEADAGVSFDSDTESDLLDLGAAATRARDELQIRTPKPPWLPRLPGVLGLARVAAADLPEASVAIGLIDLPHLQAQDPLVLDLAGSGHVAVFGAGNSGKTTALTTTALALAAARTPEQLTIYCLDAASGGLGPLAALPHCGGVVSVDEEERVHRLLRVLLERVEGRNAREDTPTTVLLIDDFGAFAQHYDRPGADSSFDRVQRILAGGRAAGVHVILTATRRGALPAALASHFGQRLILRMNTEEDMLALGLDFKSVRGAHLPRGGGFTQDSREFQIAVPVDGGKPIDLEQAVSEIDGGPSEHLIKVEVLPSVVSRSHLQSTGSLGELEIGISDSDLRPATIDLTTLHFLVVGPYRSGRSTTLMTVVDAIVRADAEASMYLVATRRSPLRELTTWKEVATTPEQCVDLVTGLIELVETEQANVTPTFLIVDDGGELADAMSATRLDRLVRISRDSDLRVIASVESGAARGIALPWIRELRREGHGLLLQPDLSGDGDLLGAKLPRRVAAPMTPGRGFIIAGPSADLIQVAS